ncbi:MAG: RNA polymerase sigma factor [Chthoniobacterales bacterium]
MATTSDSAEPDDWRLAGLARNGDEDAYAALIERHHRAIHAFIYRHVGDAETVRELTQEVFVRAWFALDRARPRARFTTWLFQIAINLCRDHAKSKAARQARITDSTVHRTREGGEEEREFPASAASPDRAVQSSEALDFLESEIALLSVDLREAFLLGAVDGWPHKEIGAALGISPKAVETRIRRARQTLSERLTKLGYLDPSE